MRGIHAMAILFVGWLAVTAQCRLEAGRRSYLDGGDNNATVANAVSSLDDARFTLILCGKWSCDFGDCYCCDIRQTPCFKTLDECKSKCPKCNPKCPPPESSMELHA
ncbi:hypothetical protein ACQJBY_051016 [Aegilops geniculata]